jgi:hypothetical protein
MRTSRDPAEPLSFFSHAALGAGWYFCWRMTVYTFPFWGGGLLVAGGLVYVGPELVPLAAVAGALGLLGAFVASIPLTNRIARGWALARLGRRLERGVWWGIFWRVLLVSLVAGAVLGVAQFGAALYAATLPWSPTQLFVSMIPYAVLIANIVVTLRAYGWAMSTMVARRLGGTGVGPGPGMAAAPVRLAAPSAPSAGGGIVCPKCGGREIETGTVIGRYCRVCGWRERPA